MLFAAAGGKMFAKRYKNGCFSMLFRHGGICIIFNDKKLTIMRKF